MTSTLISDSQRFNGAKYGSGHELKTYNDGFGPLWISRNSIGINGIVRARTWEDAYSICEDEFFPEADETMEEIIREYGFRREHVKIVNDGFGGRDAKYPEDYPDGRLASSLLFVRWETRETPDPDAWMDNELFQEGFGFRDNGPNATDVHNHGIYSRDLNGDYLDLLTEEMVKDLGITLEIISEDE
jgi:hypothetical protein